jgi:hypothetical protein
MAKLNRHWLPIRACAMRSYALCNAICLAAIVHSLDDIAHAAPITFRFDAEIVSVSDGSPFDLPLSYRVGDVIHGVFTFDPEVAIPLGDNAIVAPQPFEFLVNVNGAVVGSTTHAIRVFDNTGISHFDVDVVDTMTIGCSEPSCIPNFVTLGDGESFRVRSRLTLIGSTSVQNSAILTGNPEIWNAFLFQRNLSLNFDNDGIGSVGFSARVGNFRLVSEPKRMPLFACAVCILKSLYRTKRVGRFFHVRNLQDADSAPVYFQLPNRAILAKSLWGPAFISLSLVFPWLSASAAFAGPITFRFDATVKTVLSSNPIDLPFSIQPSDVISGRFTFDPGTAVSIGDNAVEGVQSLGLTFTIDGVAFGSTTYRIQAFNNTPISDDVIEGPIDTVNIQCSSIAGYACSPTFIEMPGVDPFTIGVRLSLLGPISILDLAHISADPAKWNSFQFERHLRLTFNDLNDGSMLVGAQVGEFLAVPEPSDALLVLVAVVCLVFSIVSRRMRGIEKERRILCCGK